MTFRLFFLEAGALLLLWLACSGCAGVSHVGGRFEPEDPDAPRALHRISGSLNSHYERRKKATLSAFETRVLATLRSVAQGAGRQPPQTDDAAHRAAREIGHSLPAKGPPPSVLVDFAMRSHGLVEPPPHMVIADVPADSETQVLDQLAGRFRRILASREFSRVGLALTRSVQTPERRRVVVALLESRVRFVPFPRAWTLGQRQRLLFSVAPSHRRIKVVVTSPKGQVAPARVRRSGEQWSCWLRCATRGSYQIEVTGEGQYGVEVLANFPVYCGQQPPRQVRYVRSSRQLGSVGELEREIFERTNQIRRRMGLSPLTSGERLAKVARDHSRDMRSAGFVGHVSPSTGRPSDRLREADVVFQVVRENVARAYSPVEAMSELMNSPAHRDNITAKDVSQLGVGIALDRSESTPVLLVTQLFIQPGKRYEPSTAAGDIIRIVHQSRKKAGVDPLRMDPSLSRLAAQFVKTVIAHDGDQTQANAHLSKALRRLGNRFSQVDGLTVKLTVLDTLAQAEEILRKRYTHLGLGVDKLQGHVLVFLLLGSAR